MNIVVLDGYGMNPGDLSWEKLGSLGNLTVYDRTPASDTAGRISDADIVLTNKVVIDRAVMSASPRLRYIGVLATGYNVVDIDEARKRGIVVTNIPAYSTESVVQMTFAHILNITNRVAHYAHENRSGRWSRNPDFVYWDTPLHELQGQTIGIVGLGHIGKRVAHIARDFGMDVFAITSKNSADLPAGIQKTTLTGLLGISDIITLHCPLTPSTRHLINEDTLRQMKHGAILINTGRGPLVDEVSVAAALTNGHLAGYGADVMTHEPPEKDNPLFTAPNAFITPHIAWASSEARARLMTIAVENVKCFIGGKARNRVS